jgi:hypothetical protein
MEGRGFAFGRHRRARQGYDLIKKMMRSIFGVRSPRFALDYLENFKAVSTSTYGLGMQVEDPDSIILTQEGKLGNF